MILFMCNIFLMLIFVSSLEAATLEAEMRDVKVIAYVIKSNGDAKDKLPELMGVYRVSEEKHNNLPVYKQVGGSGLIYVDGSYWLVKTNSLKGGAWMFSLKPSGLSPPATGWKYWSRGWKTDSTLSIISADQVKCIGSLSDLDCCSSTSPCQEKQGNCNGDSDCAGSLVCGRDNCKDFNPVAKPTADCCMAPKVIAYFLQATGGARQEYLQLMGIYGVSEKKHNNFPIYKQVGGPGLIYVDASFGLDSWVVGYNSLNGSLKMFSKRLALSPPSTGWKYDCEGWKTDSTLTFIPANQVKCIGSLSDLDCCSSASPCQEKQGNCNGDSDCEGSLVCGQDNCKDFNPMAKPTADCCMAPKGKCDPYSNPTRKDNMENVTLFGAGGTMSYLPNIIKKTDGTKFNRTSYMGKQQRIMYDGKIDGGKDINVTAFIFKSLFSDNMHVPVEFRINPEFETEAKAKKQAIKYSKALGRIPLFLRARIEFVDLSKGTFPQGGNAWGSFCKQRMFLPTGYGRYLTKAGTLENLFIHEGCHVSLDDTYRNLGEWICAQNDDGKFISSYGRNHPHREDMAESLVAWYAVMIHPERLSQELANKIKDTIPHRLQFFNKYFNKQK